jgi:hypothetical protein
MEPTEEQKRKAEIAHAMAHEEARKELEQRTEAQ